MHVGGPAFDAALQRRLERLVAGVVLVEGKIVAIQHHAPLAGAQQAAAAGAGWRCPRDGSRSGPGGFALLRAVLISSCTALTSELLPMPRAPHSSALLAGKPSAKRARIGEQRVALVLDRP